MLNPDAFTEARDAYARAMGFTNVNGTVKSISDISEDALKICIITYIIKDDRLKEVI
jgi:hypothetical protein